MMLQTDVTEIAVFGGTPREWIKKLFNAGQRILSGTELPIPDGVVVSSLPLRVLLQNVLYVS